MNNRMLNRMGTSMMRISLLEWNLPNGEYLRTYVNRNRHSEKILVYHREFDQSGFIRIYAPKANKSP